jgi:hypothetical protein
VRALNALSTNSNLTAEYVSTDTEAPGRIRVYGRDPTKGEFTCVVATAAANPEYVVPIPARRLPHVSVVRAANVVTVTHADPHGYSVGQQVYMERWSGSADTDFPTGNKTVATTPTSTSWTYNETGNNATALDFYVFYSQSFDVFSSDNREINNGLMWSPPGEPTAVPAVNFDTIGPSDTTIYTILPKQDHLLVLTDNGVYQVNGNGVNWAISEYDVSLEAKGKRLGVIGANKGYVFADQGFAELGESARIVSSRIDKDLRTLLASASSDVASYGFALSNAADGFVYFFLPVAAGDTSAKQVYVYSMAERSFTRWELTGGDGSGPVAQDAIIFERKVHIASGGYVVKERKSLSGVADQMDPIIPGTKSTTVTGQFSNSFTPADFGTDYWQVGTSVRNVTRSLTSTITAYAPGPGAGGAGGEVTVASAAGWMDGDTIWPTAGPVGGTNGSTIETVPMTEDDPGAQKVWKVGSLGFRDSRFVDATLKFATDLSPTYSDATTLAPPGGSTAEATAIDWWVPKSWMRGSRIKWKFNHVGSQERYALQSWTLRGRICSPSTSR